MSGEMQNLFDLTGKVALVTGGGSGLGRQFCDVLAEFGADVVCPDLRKGRAEETCEIIKKYGHKTMAIEVDVSKYDQVKAMFEQVLHSFGRLDILVNNAGITAQAAPISQTALNDWHEVIDVNLHGVFYCMREGLGIMMEQRTGSVINISSIMGIGTIDPSIVPSIAGYTASKTAVVGLTKEAAAEYGEYGIRVNCIAPGFHHGTGLGDRKGSQTKYEEFQELFSSKTPLRRTAEPKELKGLLLYLASDSSSFMTGQIIAHDGGWSIW